MSCLLTILTLIALTASDAVEIGHLKKSDVAISDGNITSGCFSVTKGMKCDGSFEKEKGGGKKCAGGVMAEFYAGTEAQDIADIVAPEVHDQIQGLLPSHERRTLVGEINGDVLNAMVALDDGSLLVDMEADFEKKVEFGGFLSVFWGCNVTLAKKDAVFSKVVQCSVLGKKGLGKKPSEDGYPES